MPLLKLRLRLKNNFIDSFTFPWKFFLCPKTVKCFQPYHISLTLESFCLVYFVIFITSLIFSGGAYIPPARLKMMQQSIEDKSRWVLGGNYIEMVKTDWVILIFSGCKNIVKAQVKFWKFHVQDVILWNLTYKLFSQAVVRNFLWCYYR